jgi:hypothetical protein
MAVQISGISGFVAPISDASIELEISCRPSFWPWKITRAFRFIAGKKFSDNLAWHPYEYVFERDKNGQLKATPVSN